MKKVILLTICVAITQLFFCQNASDLFFSEYVEGSSYNKYLEIFNGTGQFVNLSDYQVLIFSNGNADENDPNYSIDLGDVNLTNGTVYTLGNNRGSLYAPIISASAVNFNGDDAIVLKKISTGQYIDVIGCIGDDPGSCWSDGDYTTVDKTLVRKSAIDKGVSSNPTNGFPTLASQWDAFETDVVGNLGSHTFSPQIGAGLNDVNDYSMIAFPNPFHYYLHIKSDAIIRSATIYNCEGDLVEHVECFSKGHFLPTVELAEGLYILQVKFEDGSVTTQKVMKK